MKSDWTNLFLLATPIHKDVTEKLKISNPQLYKQVKKVLQKNKTERHLRGGIATQLKYKNLKP
jgi:putative DeoR family transcriptional regulator (stage III sporulation protein D)